MADDEDAGSSHDVVAEAKRAVFGPERLVGCLERKGEKRNSWKLAKLAKSKKQSKSKRETSIDHEYSTVFARQSKMRLALLTASEVPSAAA